MKLAIVKSRDRLLVTARLNRRIGRPSLAFGPV